MVRVLFVFLCLFTLSFGNKQNNIFEKKCLSCHKKIDVKLDKFLFRYLLKHSSEKNVKEAMFNYLKNPSKDTTIMSEAFILRYKIKSKSKLKDEDLQKAIDIYWEQYKVFGKLK